MEQRPIMHCQHELEVDLKYEGVLPDQIMLKWFNDRYSTSKHLLTLYSIAKGLKAATILEIGFGRSSFVLAKAAYENGGRLITCDNRDFSYLLSDTEKEVTTFMHGLSDVVWQQLDSGIDFAFLDYFSSETLTEKFCISEIKQCLSRMKTNGIICLHDSIIDEYPLKKSLQKLRKSFNIELISLPYNYGMGIIRYIGKSKYGIIEDQYPKKED